MACHVETTSEANALGRAILNYIQRFGINAKIIGMRQVAAPNIESSDLSLSESDRLRSKVRCFGFAFPGGTITEASKVALGACVVLKPRNPNTHHPQRRHPLPRGICSTRRKARLGDCQIQWKGRRLGECLGLPSRDLLRSQCTRPSHLQITYKDWESMPTL